MKDNKNYWSTKPSDLVTADGQKIIGGSKKVGRGGKNPSEGSKKGDSKKRVVVKKGAYKSLIEGWQIDT